MSANAGHAKKRSSAILGRSPYGYLLNDPDVKRWFSNVKRGSPVTAYEWVRRLGWIGREFEITPSQLAHMSQKAATNFVLDMVTALEERGFSGNYIDNLVKPVRSWLDFNQIPLLSKVKIEGRGKSKKYEGEHVPLPQELKRVLEAADLRKKSALALVAFTGIRIETLGDYEGNDGLEVRDFPEMVIYPPDPKKGTAGRVEFLKIPTRMIVRDTISKAGHTYEVFLNDEGCEILQSFLETRMSLGETLTSNTPIITPIQHKNVGLHMRSQNISELLLKKPIEKAGFDWRPYVLRRYADTRLMMAESDGFVIFSWRQFWMAHKGDIEAVYTLNKRNFNPDLLEKMRGSFRRCSDAYLTTRKMRLSEDEIFSTMNRRVLMVQGYTREELDKLGDLGKLTHDEVQRLLDQKKAAVVQNAMRKMVSSDKLDELLQQGWDIDRELKNGKVIVKKLAPMSL